MTTECDKSDEPVTSVPFSLFQYLCNHLGGGGGMQKQMVFKCAIPFAITNFVMEISMCE